MGISGLASDGLDVGRLAAWVDLDSLSYRDAQAYVRALEEVGVSMISSGESRGREAFTLAQLCLAATDHVVIASTIVRTLERDPRVTAAAQATLWDGFPARYLLGLGVALAVRDRGSAPVSFLEDYITSLDEHSNRLTGRSKPLPRIIGTYSPGLTHIAATRASGLTTYLVTPAHTIWARQELGSDPFLNVCQWVLLDEDPESARAIGRKQLSYYLPFPHTQAKLRRLGFDDEDLAGPGSDRLVDACLAWGSIDQIAARLNEHREAGADQVSAYVISPPSGKTIDDFAMIVKAFG